MTLSDKAATFLKLHTDPELLVLVNVWDAVSAKVVADSPGCRALATASHSIAASHGYPDGEKIPLDLMIDTIGRIVAAVDLPVSADLESGYGDVGETVRRAIGVGAVGANLEDAMRPLDESVTAVSTAVKAGEAEGISFVLNARTDAFLRAGTVTPRRFCSTRSSAAGPSSKPVLHACSSPAGSTSPRSSASSPGSGNAR